MPSAKPAQGISRTTVIIAFAAVIFAIVLIFLIRLGSTRTTAPCNSQNKQVCAYLTQWQRDQQKGYRIQSVESVKGQLTSRFVESIDSGRFMRILNNSATAPYEAILINKTAYIRDPADNRWWSQEFSEEELEAYKKDLQISPSRPASKDAQMPTYTRVGDKSSCGDNRSCYTYNVIQLSDRGTQKVWVDVVTNRLYQLQFSNEAGVNTYTYSYDNLRVDAPASVKKLNSQQKLQLGSNQPIAK